MLSDNRARVVQDMVDGAKPNTMRSTERRRAFAQELAERTGMNPTRVQSFVDEMRGLNFYNDEDRQTFIVFAIHGL
jgi:hypothetical protein